MIFALGNKWSRPPWAIAQTHRASRHHEQEGRCLDQPYSTASAGGFGFGSRLLCFGFLLVVVYWGALVACSFFLFCLFWFVFLVLFWLFCLFRFLGGLLLVAVSVSGSCLSFLEDRNLLKLRSLDSLIPFFLSDNSSWGQ